MSLYNLFEVKTYDYKKRYGVNKDGGYVCGIIDNYKYDCYISCGIEKEESFTRDFLKEHNYLQKKDCYGFDGTIDNYPYEYTQNIQFIKKI